MKDIQILGGLFEKMKSETNIKKIIAESFYAGVKYEKASIKNQLLHILQ